MESEKILFTFFFSDLIFLGNILMKKKWKRLVVAAAAASFSLHSFAFAVAVENKSRFFNACIYGIIDNTPAPCETVVLDNLGLYKRKE